jgi:hypothetical protein
MRLVSCDSEALRRPATAYAPTLANIMKPILCLIFILVIGCDTKTERNKDLIENKDRGIENEEDTLDKSLFFDYPIPNLDSILQYYETSGAVENAPSKRYYNPSDSGIFVFYTLFDKKLDIGTLTTHTYRKPKYGWAAEDKDQTFILLRLTSGSIKIGKSIKIGQPRDEVKLELGQPIYQDSSRILFVGKNKVIALFGHSNGLISSITYGRFNLTDDIFNIDSISRQRVIIEKLGGLR